MTQNKVQTFKKMSGGKIRCNLCPHFCFLRDGQTGKCKARINKDEQINSIHAGSVSSLAVEPVEKKPFKHFLPGTRNLTYGSWGCSLFCKFCENFSISQVSPDNKQPIISPDALVSMAKTKNCQSVSMSYNEPTIMYEFLIDLAEQCHKEDLKFLLKTNAFINRYPWREVCRVTDAMNIDWKGSEEKFKLATGVRAYVLQDRIKEAYEAGVHIEISIPLYFQEEELEEEIEIVGKFLSSIDKEIPCHLLGISPSYKYDDFIFDSQNFNRSEETLSKYMNNIYRVI